MPVFARRDLQTVAVSGDHGGCGQIHLRPAGADLWELDCPQCSDHLRHDPLWSSTISEIPETPDEFITREDWAKRGAADQQYVMAMALARMAGVEIPESLTRVITGRTRPAIESALACPDGHEVRSGAKFCRTCGKPPVAADVIRCKDGHANAPDASFCDECGAPMGMLVPGSVVPDPAQITAAPAAPRRKPALKDMRLADLQARCQESGLPADGNRADLIARLRAAK